MHKEYLQAGNPDTALPDLQLLAKHSNSRVRRRVAENPNADLTILESLSQDSDPEVRIAVARNQNRSSNVLENLSNDESVAVRFGLASAHDLPIKILEKLAKDDHPYISSRAERTLEGLFLEEALKEISFVHQPQEEAKLGDVLVRAEILTKEQINQYLETAKANGLPLGRTLVQSRALPRGVIVMALQAQLQVRKKIKSLENAIDELRQKIKTSQIMNSTGFMVSKV